MELIKAHRQGRLNLVAIGRTGDGKSATLNSILEHSDVKETALRFVVSAGSRSVTKIYNERTANIMDVNCRLIDTVGLFDTELTKETHGQQSVYCAVDLDEDQAIVLRELSQVIQLCQDGIDAFLFVINGVGRFTMEIKETIKIMIRFFGTVMLEHCIFVLTRKDDRESKKQMEVMKTTVQNFVVMCGGPSMDTHQFVEFDNANMPSDQVEELLGSVGYLLARHQGRPYENAAFVAAKDLFEKKKAEWLEKKRRQLDDTVAEAMKKVTQEYEAKSYSIESQLMAKEKELQKARKEAKNNQQLQEQIDSLYRQAQNNIDAAERERNRRKLEAKRAAKLELTNEEIRRMESRLADELASNRKIIEKLKNDVSRLNAENSSKSKFCSVM